MSDELRPFYTLSSDLVSLFTVLASACRLPIYIACNARIRCEVLDALNNCVLFRAGKDEKIKSPKNLRSRATTVRYCDTGCGFMVYEDKNNEEATLVCERNVCLVTFFPKVFVVVGANVCADSRDAFIDMYSSSVPQIDALRLLGQT
ncbi:hypothetical protein NECAME_18100 [Necator americanus]|uniref:Uncharacterized protein n=1 Tax=Necator americanus TaxID=51031 RepID=W2TEZ5_NECAM|nr:hypothetical protein NECAME_18100 [Necator americanus]ETN79587.1 hypothetical protein NECAME_18100 [Necator americanus]